MKSCSTYDTGEHIVDWQRHDGTEQLAVLPTDKRKYLYSAPVLRENLGGLLDYDSCSDLGISLTLNYRLWRAFHYTEVLAKQSLWFIKHLCERTDLITEGVPIRFGITSDLERIVIPYLDACQFPMELVDWIESKEAVYPQSTKLLHMKHDSFKNIKRVLHMDLSFHFDTDETQWKGTWFRNVKQIWRAQPMALPFPLLIGGDVEKSRALQSG